jgi:hypothetical protein
MGHIAAHPIAAQAILPLSQLYRPHLHPPCSCTAISLPPSQPHMLPPPIVAMHILLSHASLLHRPCCLPLQPHTSHLHGHIAASLTATHIATLLPPVWAISQHAPSLHRPHHLPYSHTDHISAHLAVAQPCHCLPCSHTCCCPPL